MADSWIPVSKRLQTRELIIADERYHTCGRCKWDETPDDMYPCNQCVHGTDMRKDFWEYAEGSETNDRL